MAGRGSRFINNGYQLPKPFIPVIGLPMYVVALKSFPPPNRFIFVCQQEFLRKYSFEQETLIRFPASTILSVKEVTEGQACTCLLAEKYLEPDEDLLISSIDYQLVYNEGHFRKLCRDSDVDVIVFTFKTGGVTKKDPKAFAYCRVEQGRVTEIIEKQTISNAPHLDPAVTGSFWYRHCNDFVRGAKEMIAKNIRINGEFYVGTSINQLIEAGLNVVPLEVDKFVSFGDPFEMELFDAWEEFFYKEPLHPYSGWNNHL
jgi:dTDP-glucose pyrophosphorylase